MPTAFCKSGPEFFTSMTPRTVNCGVAVFTVTNLPHFQHPKRFCLKPVVSICDMHVSQVQPQTLRKRTEERVDIKINTLICCLNTQTDLRFRAWQHFAGIPKHFHSAISVLMPRHEFFVCFSIFVRS